MKGSCSRWDKHQPSSLGQKAPPDPPTLPEKRMEWEKTIERSNRRRINIDCLAQVGIRHPGAKLTTLGRGPRAEKNRKKSPNSNSSNKSHPLVSWSNSSRIRFLSKFFKKKCFISLVIKENKENGVSESIKIFCQGLKNADNSLASRWRRRMDGIKISFYKQWNSRWATLVVVRAKEFFVSTPTCWVQTLAGTNLLSPLLFVVKDVTLRDKFFHS